MTEVTPESLCADYLEGDKWEREYAHWGMIRAMDVASGAQARMFLAQAILHPDNPEYARLAVRAFHKALQELIDE